MQRCKFCGSALPARARFCGSCGRTLYEVGDRATELSNTPTLDLPASESAAQTPPIKPVRLQPLHDAAENQYPGATERYPWPVPDSEQLPTLADNQQNDEDEWQRRGMILGAPFLTMLAEDAQAPAGNVPMVQGTPQASGLPMVQGTPQAPANPPAGQLYVQNPAPSAPSTTPNAGSWVPHTPPPQHGTGEFTGHHHQTHSPARHHVSGELAHHHVSGELPTGPLDTSHHRARSRRRHLHGPHHLVSTLIVATIAIVVIVISGLGIGLAIIHPSLSLSGSSSVVSGGTMSLHGRNFIPGSSVTLTLDNGLPLAYAGHGVTRQAGSYAAGLATAFQISAAGQLAQSTTNAPVPVNGTGSFDITIHVSESWPFGRHTIHAMDSVLGRSAELQFTVAPKQGGLELRPSTLDFGKLQKGTRAILSVVLSNTGKHPLTWQAALANAASTSWLKVQPVTGTIGLGAEQFIYVIADTGGLKVGSYSAMLDISSDAGNTRVPVNLQVIQPGKPQAHLVVNSQTLDFGQLVVGNQSTLPVTIGNVGTLALDWKANTGNASWLTLDSNTGTVKPGGLPRVIQVTANATGLAAGNYSATLSITSNGGSAQVTVTMVVINGPPPPPTLASSPGSFNVPGDPNCTYNANTGWTCVVSLSSSQSAQANLNWIASSSGVNGVTFSQASGTLSPGQTAQVSVSIPNTACPSQADFTFTGPGNATNVLWSCAPPKLIATPPMFSTGCLSCSVTLALGPGSQGGLQWSTPSNGIGGVTYKPASGTLLAGQTAQVSITVPSTTCPAGTVFVFAGPVNTASVTWNCVLPKLTVKNIAATQNVRFSSQVATVSDAAATDPSQLSATIDWGDGSSTSPGTVSVTNGTFTVSGSYTYTTAGSFTITVTVTDTTTKQTGKGTGTATVYPPVQVSGQSTPTTQNVQFSGPVATVSDAAATGPSQLSATIDWGDGSSTPQAMVSGANGTFTVSGSHTYTITGSFTITVTVTDTTTKQIGSGTATAMVNPPPVQVSGQDITATADIQFSGQVATVSDAAATDPSQLSATIDWGDGSSTPQAMVSGANGTFTVSGSYTYATAGSLKITISVTDITTKQIGSGSGKATVNPPPVQVSGQSAPATQNVQFSGQVATVSDAAATGPSQLSVTINWGDNTGSTTGTVSVANGTFTVIGSHTYTSTGSFTISISVKDTTTNQTGSGSGTATVAAPPVQVSGQDITATADVQFSGQVATVSDAAATDPKQFSATIDWGDKTGSTTGIVSVANGTFTVTGSHTYATTGSYKITITVTDTTTSQTGTGTGTATVYSPLG